MGCYSHTLAVPATIMAAASEATMAVVSETTMAAVSKEERVKAGFALMFDNFVDVES